MQQFQYRSYDEYVEAQTQGNIQKLHHRWVAQRVIKFISVRYPAKTILCHGTRNAAEQKWFRKYYPDAEWIMGTEISHTATRFPMTIQWDFAEPRDEWKGACDIVYSNAFDHAYDPRKTLNTWLEQLTPAGRLMIEISKHPQEHNLVSPVDPLDIGHDELATLVAEVGGRIVRCVKTSRGWLTAPNGESFKPDCRMHVIRRIK